MPPIVLNSRFAPAAIVKRAALAMLLPWAMSWPNLAGQDIPPPPREPGQSGQHPGDQPPHSGPGPHGMMPGGMPHSGWHERGDSFKQLSEAERQRVREAFDKVWNRPEVAAAKEQLNKANNEYRQTIQRALKEVDPEVVKILDRVKPPFPSFANVHMPEPNDPEFASKAVGRLAAELQGAGHQGPDHRDGMMMQVHQRIVQTPVVKDAITLVQQARTPGERIEAWRRLHDAYVSTARQIIGANRENKEPRPPRPPDAPTDKP